METIIQLVSEVEDGLHLPKLADDLHVLSCLLYKQNNIHRKYKFYQTLKQVETYMKKFVELKIKDFVIHKNSASQMKDPHHFIDFSTQVFKGYLLLNYVRRYCKNVVRLSLQQLTLSHFISLHLAIISLVSSVDAIVGKLQENVYLWYMKVQQIASARKLKVPHLSQARIDVVNFAIKIRKLSKRETDLLKNLKEDKDVIENKQEEEEKCSVNEDKPDTTESFLAKMKRLLEFSGQVDRKRKLDPDDCDLPKKLKS